jgi:hypothetical protein
MTPQPQAVPIPVPSRVPQLATTGQQAPAQMPPQPQAPATSSRANTPPAGTGTFSSLQAFVVPHLGEQPARDLYRHPEEHAQLGHNECVVSGLGRRRALDDKEERLAVGLFFGFRLTDTVTRDLPLNRHVYSGCFMAVRRLWHDHD